MIERAGYPTVASAVDENLVQSVLPAVEEKAFQLVAENKK
jgi:hypothetical protein